MNRDQERAFVCFFFVWYGQPDWLGSPAQWFPAYVPKGVRQVMQEYGIITGLYWKRVIEECLKMSDKERKEWSGKIEGEMLKYVMNIPKPESADTVHLVELAEPIRPISFED